MKKLLILSIIGLLSCQGEQQTTTVEEQPEVVVDTVKTQDSSIIKSDSTLEVGTIIKH